MSAFLSISVWVTLATVIPGLITITVIFWSIVIVNVDWLYNLRHPLEGASNWVWAGSVAAIMVTTQFAGIILEGILVKKKWLGKEKIIVNLAQGIDPHGETEIAVNPYHEYGGLYVLLAELKEDEDAHGHLQRALSQFFLTNNVLISFSLGIVMSFVLIIDYAANFDVDRETYLSLVVLPSLAYVCILSVLLVVTFKVAVTRFQVMAKCLWAARRLRIRHLEEENENVKLKRTKRP